MLALLNRSSQWKRNKGRCDSPGNTCQSQYCNFQISATRSRGIMWTQRQKNWVRFPWHSISALVFLLKVNRVTFANLMSSSNTGRSLQWNLLGIWRSLWPSVTLHIDQRVRGCILMPKSRKKSHPVLPEICHDSILWFSWGAPMYYFERGRESTRTCEREQAIEKYVFLIVYLTLLG
jgi:hypothetical protein